MSSSSAAAADAQGAKQSTSSQPGEGSAPFEPANADLLRAAGVPEEAVTAFESLQEQQAPPVAEQQEEAKQPDPDVAPAGTESAEETNPEQETATEEHKPETEHEEHVIEETETPGKTEETASPGEEETGEENKGWYQKRVGKWTRQKERMQDEIEDLKLQLEQEKKGGRPATAEQPSPWTAADTIPELQRTVEVQRQVRDWCLKNPDGAVLNEGKENERVVPPEEVRDSLVGALRILEDAPRKAQEIQQRAEMRAFAQSEWPELFDTTSEIHQTSQQFLQQYPAIAQSPNRDMILGLMVEGWKPFKARVEARRQGKNGNGTAAAATNGNGKLPEALTRKIPPIPKTSAPNPPRGSRVPSPIKNAAAAVERVVQDGATPESVMNAIAAIEAQNAVSSDTKRTPAPV